MHCTASACSANVSVIGGADIAIACANSERSFRQRCPMRNRSPKATRHQSASFTRSGFLVCRLSQQATKMFACRTNPFAPLLGAIPIAGRRKTLEQTFCLFLSLLAKALQPKLPNKPSLVLPCPAVVQGANSPQRAFIDLTHLAVKNSQAFVEFKEPASRRVISRNAKRLCRSCLPGRRAHSRSCAAHRSLSTASQKQ